MTSRASQEYQMSPLQDYMKKEVFSETVRFHLSQNGNTNAAAW